MRGLTARAASEPLTADGGGAEEPGPPPRAIQGMAPGEEPAALTEEQVATLAEYIVHRESMLDRDLLPLADPAGKDLLVFGSGYGNEVLWAIKRGARSIVAIDTSRVSPVPLQRVMADLGLSHPSYEFRQQNVHDTALGDETFDLIVSNGVFEHVLDLKGVLGAFRPLLRPGGRAAIFADGLWFSSIGGHVPGDPWDHLRLSPTELKERFPGRWYVVRDQLNRMTIVDFLEAVRTVGMLVLQLHTRPDPNLGRLPAVLPEIRGRLPAVSPTDCSIVAIGCELCFEENL
jgi:SAM-dependent methyltransferase